MCWNTYTCISAPPFILNKYIKHSLKIFKHLIFYINLLPLMETWKLHKINANKVIYRIKIYRPCIKIRKNDKVQKDVKNASKSWLWNATKNNNTSSHMLLDHCCAFRLSLWPSGLKKKFLKEGDPRDLFLPRPGSAPWWIWPKNNNTCKGPWVLHPYQVS